MLVLSVAGSLSADFSLLVESLASYGLMCLSILPGVSMLLESIMSISSGNELRINAVPRISVTSFNDSPAAARCAISTRARSALP